MKVNQTFLILSNNSDDIAQYISGHFYIQKTSFYPIYNYITFTVVYMTSLDQKVAAVDITNYLFVAALIFVRKVLLLFLFCHSASLRLCLHIIQKRTGRI